MRMCGLMVAMTRSWWPRDHDGIMAAWSGGRMRRGSVRKGVVQIMSGPSHANGVFQGGWSDYN